MATIFRNLFRHKKSASQNKENSAPPVEQEQLDFRREKNRHSFHGESKGNRRVTRFEEGPLSATAAYHTQNPTKYQRGPKSCPGAAYGDESEASNRSFQSEVPFHSRLGRSKKESRSSGRQHSQASAPQSQSHRGGSDFYHQSTSSGRPSYRRSVRDTSEYGSGDPSPIGQMPRHSHYDVALDGSDNDDFDLREQLMIAETSLQRCHRKNKELEQRRANEEWRRRELEKEVTELKEMQKILWQQVCNLNKENDRLKRKAGKAETKAQRMAESYSTGFNYMMPSLPSSTHHAHLQRLSFMTTPMGAMGNVSSSNTPTTSAMDSTGGGGGGGAGESLVHQHDMSLLQPIPMVQLQSMSMPPLRMDMPGGSQGVSAAGAVFPSMPIDSLDDEVDEMKNFRTETPTPIESLRGAVVSAVELPGRHDDADDDVVLSDALPRDEGYSTTTERSDAFEFVRPSAPSSSSSAGTDTTLRPRSTTSI